MSVEQPPTRPKIVSITTNQSNKFQYTYLLKNDPKPIADKKRPIVIEK